MNKESKILIIFFIIIFLIGFVWNIKQKSDMVSLELNKQYNNLLQNDTNIMSQNITDETLNNSMSKNVILNNISYNQDWCISGTIKIINDKKFTVKGLTTYQGMLLCKASTETSNEKIVHYFSDDGSVDVEISIGNRNVSSIARSNKE